MQNIIRLNMFLKLGVVLSTEVEMVHSKFRVRLNLTLQYDVQVTMHHDKFL